MEGRITPPITIGLAKQDLKAHRDENSPLQLASELAIKKTANGLYKVSNHSFDADYLVDEKCDVVLNVPVTQRK